MYENVTYGPSQVRDQAYFMDGHLKDRVFLCEKEGLECGRLYPGGSVGIGGTFQTCLNIDLLLEGILDEATSQGISNGLTLAMLTGNHNMPKFMPKKRI